MKVVMEERKGVTTIDEVCQQVEERLGEIRVK